LLFKYQLQTDRVYFRPIHPAEDMSGQGGSSLRSSDRLLGHAWQMGAIGKDNLFLAHHVPV